MNAVATNVSAEIADIEECTDVSLLTTMLHESLEITVQQIRRLAAIVKRLEELGADVTVDIPFIKYVRRVAYGQLLPELLVNLKGDQALLDKAGSLPMPDQIRIAENKPIKVMEPGGDHRLVPAHFLTRREIRQVFGRGGIRNEAEQIGWLNDEFLRKSRPHQGPDIRVDKRQNGIVVNGLFISAADLAHYLSELTPRKRRT